MPVLPPIEAPMVAVTPPSTRIGVAPLLAAAISWPLLPATRL